MAWTDSCKIDAVAQIDKRKEHSGSIRKAIRELSVESGIPYPTLRRWYYPESVPKNENTLSKPSVEKKTCTTSDLHTLTYDSGRKKIFFRLCETDGNRSLVMQEYRIGGKGNLEIPTKNIFTLSMDFIPQFRAALDQVGVLTEERCPSQSGADVSNLPEDDEAGPLSTDDVSGAKRDEQEDMGTETEPSPDHAEGTSGNAKHIRCRNCRWYAPGTKLKGREMKGSCKSQTISWDGDLFQPPDELHPCENFSPRDQQQEQDMGRPVN